MTRNLMGRSSCTMHCFLGLFGRVRRMMLRVVGRRFFGCGGEHNEFLVFQRKLHRCVTPTVSFDRLGEYIVSLDICE